MTSSSELETARSRKSPAGLRFGLDTSCLVPLLAEWQQHHERTAMAYQARLRDGQRPVLPAHALLECYSVLTRLPYPFRADPVTVEQILTKYFADTEIAGMTGDHCWRSIRFLAALGMGGGKIYDAVIASSIAEAGAAVLLTWNVKHFLTIAPPGLEVREP